MKAALIIIFITPLCFNPLLLQGHVSGQNGVQSGTGVTSSGSGYREMVYIHTDRTMYLTGETVRFRVFCLERLTSRPSGLSRVAYVELYNEDRTTLLQSRIGLDNGTGYGEIYIPTSANTGNFIIRGYTRWMRNEGPASYFHALVSVINPFKRPVLSQQEADTAISIEFYPEGGSLVHHVPARVVFTANPAGRTGMNFTGRLMEGDSNRVCEFKPLKNGTGSFYFTPDINRKYHVEIVEENETLSIHHLPPIIKKGISLQIQDTAPVCEVRLFCNDPSIISPGEPVRCITSQKGMAVDDRTLDLSNGQAVYQINSAELGEGAYTVLIYNKAGKLLTRRAGFRYSGQDRKNRMILNDTTPGTREKFRMELPSGAGSGSDSLVDLSVSVSSFMEPFSRNYINLEHYLLLDNTLNLFGNPESLFEGSADDVRELLNDLLIAFPGELTWDLPPTGTMAEYLPEARAPLATGRVLNRNGREPANGVICYLSTPGKWSRFYVSRSDNDGRLFFEMPEFFGKHEMFVQCKDSTKAVSLDDPFAKEFLEIRIPELELNETMRNRLEQQSQNMQVENAYRNLVPEETISTAIDSSAFYGEPDNRYYLDDYTRFPVMEEVMREYVYYVNVRKNSDGFHFRVNDLEFEVIYEDNPLMLLDGVPVFDADDIIALDPLRIEKIETIIRAYSRGYLDCHGLVSYSSYNGDMAGYSPPDEAVRLEYEGLQVRKKYSFPDYSGAKEERSRIPDFRNTLFWLPDGVWHTGENLFLDFFTSDDKNKYRIRINGISPNGEPYSTENVFRVK